MLSPKRRLAALICCAVLAALLTGLALWLIVGIVTFEPPPDAEGPSLGLTIIVALAMAAFWAVEALLAWLALVSAMRRWDVSFGLLIAVAAMHVVPSVLVRADSGWWEVVQIGPMPLAVAAALMLDRPTTWARQRGWE